MTSVQYPIVFQVDQEHAGLRLVIPLILFVAFWLSYFALSGVLRAVFPALNSAVVLSCLGAIPVSLVIAGVSEAVLKRTWRSGRQVVLDSTTLALHLPRVNDTVIERGKRVNALWWCFPLRSFARGGRERRVPSRYWCFAGQLQQDEERIVVYCYAPPGRMESWRERYEFHQLHPEKVYDTSFRARLGAPTRPELTPEIIASKEGRYWLAERNRWQEGVELTVDDFDTLLSTIGVNQSKFI